MPKMKKIAVVTVNYNTEEDTKALLVSLEKIKTHNFSLCIIVVDNGSKKVFTLDKKEEKQQITLIRLEDNTGFAGGYNIGIKEALKMGSEYVLIVNNDTITDPDLVYKLVAILENDPEIGITVPKIYFSKGREFHKNKYTEKDLGKVFWYAGGYTDWNNIKSIHRGVDEIDRGQYDSNEEIDFATGCCILFRKEIFEKVGFFDERFFLYFEDADLSERIKKAGYKIYYVPAAVLYHNNASSSGGAGNKLQDYFITRNQMLFGMKYAPMRSKIALIRQSLHLLIDGRPYQKKAIRDFYLGRLGKGTFFKI